MKTNLPVGENVRRARLAMGLSQAELARRTGVQPAWIAHIEAARQLPSLPNAVALADALGVSLDDLVTPHDG